MANRERYLNREISWLNFNERVLQEAADSSVPVIERLRFLGIFSNNLDEFFRVRVATLRRLSMYGKKAKDSLDYKPKRVLEQVYQTVLHQSRIFEEIYSDILQELRHHKIHVINEGQVSARQADFVKKYFIENVRAALVPIMLNQVKSFPYLKDRTIYLAIKLSQSGKQASKQYALIEIPTTVPRFISLPSSNGNHYIMLLDDIIRYNLPEVFSAFHFDRVEAYTVKITRDAELDIDNDISQSFIDKISKSVKARQKGAPVRLVYDSQIPRDLLDLLKSRMKLTDLDNIIPGGRYHNFKDFMGFPDLGKKSLVYEKVAPLQHKLLLNSPVVFDNIAKHDILLHYPYQDFLHFIDFLRLSAIDPNVKSIQITLYRVAKKSMVVNALINAAQNGKQVTVVVELQARFDEEANIKWAKRLQDAGIKVIYGVPGLKVHAKLCLVTRSENGKNKLYANITTGNYNEITSTVYADDALFTADNTITREVSHIFDFFEHNYRIHHFKHLVISPYNTRKKFIKLIQNEVENVRKGIGGSIFLKMNSLVDEEMIDELYKASSAGVKIRLVIRGICALKPQVKGLSDNIEAVSIVDKYLEHSRVFWFAHGGDNLLFISSSDYMTRNLDHRIEVSCPIYDEQCKKEMIELLELQWSDAVKARLLSPTQMNAHRSLGRKKARAQIATYQYLHALK